jgi:16S rRNA (cytidine1402-2'-O)-methyltransferase
MGEINVAAGSGDLPEDVAAQARRPDAAPPDAGRVPTLHVVATPIGNLEDCTHRAVRVLGAVDALACEDTRRTRILLQHYHLRTPSVLIAYHEHNEEAAGARIIRLLEEGRSVALCSNAGYPAISDPGYRIIAAAAARGFRVEVLPGAGAVETALVAAALPTASFTFLGFAPRKPGRRRALLEREKDAPHTLVLFESPHRTAALLAAALAVLGDRPAAVCIELTKMFEKVIRGRLSELAERFREQSIRGEVTVVIAGNTKFAARSARRG